MIHGLTPRLAEGGKIKIGGLGEVRTARSGKTYRVPEKHDCFTVTTCEREGGKPDGDLIIDQPVMDALVLHDYHDADGKVRTIPIVLHSDDLEQVFPTAYVAYQGKRLACRGNGQTAERRNISTGGDWTGESKTVECPCDLLEENSKGVRRCKYSGILHCSINVPGQSVAGSVYKWRTTSRISCEQMLGSLLQILRYTGTLQGFPLVLRVRPMRVQRPSGTVTVYVCHVELREALIDAQRSALEVVGARRQLAGAFLADRDQDYARMLQLPGGEDETEQDNVGPEFFPDAPGADRDRDPVNDPVVPATLPPNPAPSWEPWFCDYCGETHTHKPPTCPRAVAGHPPVQADPDEGSTPEQGSQEQPPPGLEPPPEWLCNACGQYHPATFNACPAPPDTPPTPTPRRKRCRKCNELSHGVENGLCPPCAILASKDPPKADLPTTKKCAICMDPFPPAGINDCLCPGCTPGGKAPAPEKQVCARCQSGPHWPASLTLVEGHGLVCGECVVVLGMAGKEPPGFACLGGCGGTVEIEGRKCRDCALSAAQKTPPPLSTAYYDPDTGAEYASLAELQASQALRTATATPPAKPAGPDEAKVIKPNVRVTDAIRMGTEAGRFTSAEALEALKADPRILDNPDEWTQIDADVGVELLGGLDCRPVTRP